VLDHARASCDRRIVLDTASDLAAARGLSAAHGFRKVSSIAEEPWLPRGVLSERWELDLDSTDATARRVRDDRVRDGATQQSHAAFLS